MMLRVHDWNDWQTYRKDRDSRPPWIKVHRRIFQNPKWAALSDTQKGHLVSIWVLAADNEGYIPDNPVIVKKLCLLDSEPDLQLLVSLGFLDVTTSGQPVDNQLTTSGKPLVCLEVEVEEEVDSTLNARARGQDKVSESFEVLWNSEPSGPIVTAERAYFRVIDENKIDTDTLASRWSEFRRRQISAGLHIPYLASWLERGGWADHSLDDREPEIERVPLPDYLETV